MDQRYQTEIATLAGGCFWCIEAVFDELRGVEKVESGYSGGYVANPTYHEVSLDKTGHAEAVQVTFDPRVVSYRELLEIFFTVHDPTTLNRQGPDIGSQYRSAVFYHTPEQLAVAEEVIAKLGAGRVWRRPVVTELAPFQAFYPAEEFHQQYYRRHPDEAYCRAIISPKVAKLRREYFAKLKVPPGA